MREIVSPHIASLREKLCLNSVLCDFNIATMMLLAPLFAFFRPFFFFVCKITFGTGIQLVLLCDFGHLHHLHLFSIDFEVVYTDSIINAIANKRIGVLYSNMNVVAVLPITAAIITRQAGQPPSAPSPPKNPLNMLPPASTIGIG